jgi:recombination protein RecA
VLAVKHDKNILVLKAQARILCEGISKEGDLIDLGAANNIVEKSGSWYSFKGERIGQGRENARTFLKDHPDMSAIIDKELRKALGMNEGGEQAEASSAAAASAMANGAAKER